MLSNNMSILQLEKQSHREGKGLVTLYNKSVAKFMEAQVSAAL